MTRRLGLCWVAPLFITGLIVQLRRMKKASARH
jgi:hypothetical protein